MASYCYTQATSLPFAEAERRVRESLKKQGFGILTEIDAQRVLKEKLGLEMERYKILGACNPPFAHRAIEAEPDIGVLLPCNVVVRADGERTVVSAILPSTQLGKVGNSALEPIAREVERRLKAVVDEATAM